jgi:hypothetical protein
MIKTLARKISSTDGRMKNTIWAKAGMTRKSEIPTGMYGRGPGYLLPRVQVD